MKRNYFVALLLSIDIHWSASAKEFENLTFDYPSFASLKYYPEYGGGYGLASDMLPGWSITEGGIPYRGLMASVSVEPRGRIQEGIQPGIESGPFAIGAYGLLFFSYVSQNSPPNPPLAMVVSQIGQVPVDAYYLVGFGHSQSVRADGVRLRELTLPPLGHTAWDIHEFAGKEVELSIVFQGNGRGSGGDFDLEGFVIPEPQTWALFVVGLGVLAGISRKTAR